VCAWAGDVPVGLQCLDPAGRRRGFLRRSVTAVPMFAAALLLLSEAIYALPCSLGCVIRLALGSPRTLSGAAGLCSVIAPSVLSLRTVMCVRCLVLSWRTADEHLARSMAWMHRPADYHSEGRD
jgi:hypothetical protein